MRTKKITFVSFKRFLAYLSASLNAIDFTGVDTTGFLKIFIVLMFFLLFADLLESNC